MVLGRRAVGVPIQKVIVVATEQDVVAPASHQGVVAAASVQIVIAGARAHAKEVPAQEVRS